MFPKTTLSITDKPSVLLILEIATPQRIHFNIKASSFRIDWGDEVIDTNDSHNYIRAGKYSVKIFSDKLLQLIVSKPMYTVVVICNVSNAIIILWIYYRFPSVII